MRTSPALENMKRMAPVARERQRLLVSKATPAERQFMKLLRRHGIPFQFQKLIFTPDRYYIVDFLIPLSPFRIIELDGSAHTGNEVRDKDREIDISRTKWRRYRVLRLKNQDVWNGKAEKVLRHIYRGGR